MSSAKRGISRKSEGKKPFTTANPEDLKAVGIKAVKQDVCDGPTALEEVLNSEPTKAVGIKAVNAVHEANADSRKEQERQDKARTEAVLEAEYTKALASKLRVALGKCRGIDKDSTNVRKTMTIAVHNWIKAAKEDSKGVALKLELAGLQNMCYILANYDKRAMIKDEHGNPEPNRSKSQSFEHQCLTAIRAALVLEQHPTAVMDEEGNVLVPQCEILPEITQKAHGKLITTQNRVTELEQAPVAFINELFDKHNPAQARKPRQKGSQSGPDVSGMLKNWFDSGDKALTLILSRVRAMENNQPGATMTPSQWQMLATLGRHIDNVINEMEKKPTFAARVIEGDKDVDDPSVLVPATVEATMNAYLGKKDDQDAA